MSSNASKSQGETISKPRSFVAGSILVSILHEENLEIQNAVFSKRKKPIGTKTSKTIYSRPR